MKEKATEDLPTEFQLDRESMKNTIHGLRSGLNRELKKEGEGKVIKWKFFSALSYMKDDIIKNAKVS